MSDLYHKAFLNAFVYHSLRHILRHFLIVRNRSWHICITFTLTPYHKLASYGIAILFKKQLCRLIARNSIVKRRTAGLPKAYLTTALWAWYSDHRNSGIGIIFLHKRRYHRAAFWTQLVNSARRIILVNSKRFPYIIQLCRVAYRAEFIAVSALTNHTVRRLSASCHVALPHKHYKVNLAHILYFFHLSVIASICHIWRNNGRGIYSYVA